MITSEETQARTARAVQAAAAAGRDLGLEIADPAVLHNAFSIIVHLAPARVVVRVPMVLPPSMDEQEMAIRQQRELDFAGWLAGTGFPAVPPSPLVPARPVARDGFSMTFWEFFDLAEDHIPYGTVDFGPVAELHAAMRDYPAAGQLPFLAPVNTWVPSLLAVLEANPTLIAPADLERARNEWNVLQPVLSSREAFQDRFPTASVQPLHGDGPAYNVLHTMSGLRFGDFEDVTLGPVEWDLALCSRAGLDSYNAQASRLGLPAADIPILKVMNAARLLQMVANLALVPELPLLAASLKPTLDAWRKMSFAGGLT